MTTHDDLETRLRASLRERADDVDTTPALYERVQHQATRGTWLRRGLALAGAAAVVAGTFVVVPSLLPEPDIDIADTPEDAQPTDGPTQSVDGGPGFVPAQLAAQLFELNVAYAVDDGSGGSVLQVGGRSITSPQPIVSLDAATSGGSAALVVGFADGSLGGVNVGDEGDDFDQRIDARANGSKAIVAPGVDGVAWIEGTMLYVLPFADGAEPRGMPLEGDVPDNLEIEDWTAQSDAQVIFASEPDGTVWRIPMDDSNVTNTAPTDPASVLDPDAVDAALLQDLTQVALRVPGVQAAASLAIGPNVISLGDQVTDPTAELAGNGQVVTLLDPTTSIGTVLHIDGDGTFDDVLNWQDAGITAAVSITGTSPAQPPPSGDAPGPSTGDAAGLGLPTDAPVIGTAGTDLLVRGSDGEVQTIAVYPSESEATLGRLAVRPGSTLEDGLVAVESSSEGENSIRFVALQGGEATPVGDVLVTDGPVTGLVWSEDGAQVAWTDTNALHYGTVDGEGVVDGGGEVLTQDARPVVDWVWTGTDGDAATGHVTVTVAGGTGVELLGVDRAADGALTLTGPAGGGDRVTLDTHAAPGAGQGPTVVADLTGGAAQLGWFTEDGEDGVLPDAGVLGGDVRVEASGGHVLVMGDSRQALVTFGGEVTDLPPAAAWDVLD